MTAPAPHPVTHAEAVRLVRGASYRQLVADAAGDIVDRLVLEGVVVLEEEKPCTPS